MNKKLGKLCSGCSRRKRCSHRRNVESGKQIGCPLTGPGDNMYVWG